jgi:hypothetical protein
VHYSRPRFAPRVIVLLTCLASASVAQAANPLRPLRAATPPVIDGRLDDEVWQKAPSVTGFTTWMPDYGKNLSERTLAYYAYDAENLYFAVRAYDREPSKIKASMANRDNIRPDDWICLNLDTFNDQQGLYSFYVNPLGIQMDSRFAGNKEDFGFDAVWHSAGRLDEQGYTVEVQIPFKSIRYSGRNPVMMGVVFERYISRRTEDGTVPALDPKMGFNFVLQTAPMELRDVKHYTLLEVLPAATYSRQQAADAGQLAVLSSGGDLGVTAKYGLTAQLTADGTYNPDFSQVESDAGQIDINLRAPLFYPEKRPFFLEGQDAFNLGGPSQTGPLQAIVHTRTVVNPLGGLKLSGKLAQRDTLAAIYAADELPRDAGASSEPASYAQDLIVRYKRALDQDSYVGAFLTDRETDSGFNRVAGADGSLRLDKSAAVGFYAFGSRTRAPGESATPTGRALGIEYSRNTRDLSIVAGGNDISRGFNAGLGYLTRTGVTAARAIVTPKFYPTGGLVNRVDTQLMTEQTRDTFSGTWETFNQAAALVRFRGATSVNVGYHYSSEVYLDEKFPTSGVSATVQTQVIKQLRLAASVADRDAIYYSDNPFAGRLLQATATITYQPSEQWSEQASFSYARFDAASTGTRIYDYGIARSRTTFQFNRYLFARAILEYNTFRRQLTTDFLVSFTYIPGTVLHAGFGSLYEKPQWDAFEVSRVRSFTEIRRGLFFKASYLWRL